MLDKIWWEGHLGNVTFYFGFFNLKRGDIRFGGTLGLREGSLDLGILTLGYSY